MESEPGWTGTLIHRDQDKVGTETSTLRSKGQASTGELEPMTVLITSWVLKL